MAQSLPVSPVPLVEMPQRVAEVDLDRGIDGRFEFGGEPFTGVIYRKVEDYFFEAFEVEDGVEVGPYADPLLDYRTDRLFCGGASMVHDPGRWTDGTKHDLLFVNGRHYSGAGISFDSAGFAGNVEYLSIYDDGEESWQTEFDPSGSGRVVGRLHVHFSIVDGERVRILQRQSWEEGVFDRWVTVLHHSQGAITWDPSGAVEQVVLQDGYLDLVARLGDRLLMSAWTDPELLVPMRVAEDRLSIDCGAEGRPALEALLGDGSRLERVRRLEVVTRQIPESDLAWLLDHDWRSLQELRLKSVGVPRGPIFGLAVELKRRNPAVIVSVDDAKLLDEAPVEVDRSGYGYFVFNRGFDALIGIDGAPLRWDDFYDSPDGRSWLTGLRDLRWFRLDEIGARGPTAVKHEKVAAVVRSVRPDVEVLSTAGGV